MKAFLTSPPPALRALPLHSGEGEIVVINHVQHNSLKVKVKSSVSVVMRCGRIVVFDELPEMCEKIGANGGIFEGKVEGCCDEPEWLADIVPRAVKEDPVHGVMLVVSPHGVCELNLAIEAWRLTFEFVKYLRGERVAPGYGERGRSEDGLGFFDHIFDQKTVVVIGNG